MYQDQSKPRDQRSELLIKYEVEEGSDIGEPHIIYQQPTVPQKLASRSFIPYMFVYNCNLYNYCSIFFNRCLETKPRFATADNCVFLSITRTLTLLMVTLMVSLCVQQLLLQLRQIEVQFDLDNTHFFKMYCSLNFLASS